jgi:hypothetical protein
VCANCIERTDPKTSTELLNAWTGLLTSEWDDLRQQRVVNGDRRELGGLVLNFVQWHTESRLRAFGILPARS